MTPTELSGERGQAIKEAAKGWEETTGRLLTRAILNDIEYYIDCGCASDLFIKAYEVTADKGLGWRYVKGILQNCLEDGILTAYDWDWRLRTKKGIAQFKKEFPLYRDDESLQLLYLAVNVFREEIEDTKADLRRYLLAVEGGDISEWDERWGGLPPITDEMIAEAKKGAAEKSKAYREKRQSLRVR